MKSLVIAPLIAFYFLSGVCVAEVAPEKSCVWVEEVWIKNDDRIDKYRSEILNQLIPQLEASSGDYSKDYETVKRIGDLLSYFEEASSRVDQDLVSDPNIVLSFQARVLAIEDEISNKLISLIETRERFDDNKEPNRSTFADNLILTLAKLNHQSPGFLPFLRRALVGESLRANWTAAEAMAILKPKDKKSVDALLVNFRKSGWGTDEAISALGDSGTTNPAVIVALTHYVRLNSLESESNSRDHSAHAVEALAKLKPQDPTIIDFFVTLLSKNKMYKHNIIDILAGLRQPSPQTIKQLLKVLSTPGTNANQCEDRVAALRAFGHYKIKSPEIIGGIRRELLHTNEESTLSCQDGHIVAAAERALREIDPEDFVLDRFTKENFKSRHEIYSKEILESLVALHTGKKYCPDVERWTAELFSQKENNVEVWHKAPITIQFLTATCDVADDAAVDAIASRVRGGRSFFSLENKDVSPAIQYLARVRPAMVPSLVLNYLQTSYEYAERLSHDDVLDYERALNLVSSLHVATPEVIAFLDGVIKNSKRCELANLSQRTLDRLAP